MGQEVRPHKSVDERQAESRRVKPPHCKMRLRGKAMTK